MVVVPLNLRVPLTFKRSFMPPPTVEGSPDNFITHVPPFRTRLLLKIMVKGVVALPRVTVEPEPTVTVPPNDPNPNRVWPLPRDRPAVAGEASIDVPLDILISDEMAIEPLGPRTILPAVIKVGPV